MGSKQQSPELLKIEPLLLRTKQAAALCGLAVSTWNQLLSTGRTPPSIKIGKARLWRLDILRKWTQWNCPPIDKFKQLLESEVENEK